MPTASTVTFRMLSVAIRTVIRMADAEVHQLSLLVKLVPRGVNNNASHASNGTQNGDNDANSDAEPGGPKVPL